MTRFSRFLRITVRVAVGTLFGATVLTVTSYFLGESYASGNEAAQHEVWSAYLNEEINPQTTNQLRPRVVVMQDHTHEAYRPIILALMWPAAVLSGASLGSRLRSLQAGTFSRYLLANLRSHPVQRKLNLSAPCRLADSDAVATYGQEGTRWDELFPGSAGYVVLSSVGFNSDQTQALLQFEHYCGLCGHGGYVLLSKINGHWVIKEESGTWVS